MIWERKPRPPNLIVRKKITQTPLSWEWVTGCIVSKESGSKTLSVNVVNSLLMTVAFSSPLNAWFRPSLDEALQWRDSLDKLLQNNCKLELSFIKGQGRDRGQKKKSPLYCLCPSSPILTFLPFFKVVSAREGCQGSVVIQPMRRGRSTCTGRQTMWK